MYKIIDSRGSGKTSRLMLLAKEQNGVIVCNNPSALKNKALNYGIVGIDFVNYQEYIDYLQGYTSTIDNRPIFIDELEMFIQYLDETVKGFSLSKED